MEIILRVFQVFLAIGLIGVVLLQRSEGGGLGIGSSGGAGSFMSVRGTANFLTRVTAILAALFMITCLALALLAKPNTAQKSIFDVPTTTSKAPAPAEKPLSLTLPLTAPPAPVTLPPVSAPPAAAAPQKTGPARMEKKAPQTGAAHTPGQ